MTEGATLKTSTFSNPQVKYSENLILKLSDLRVFEKKLIPQTLP